MATKKTTKKDSVLWGKAIESILQRRVKFIGDKETVYTGYPAQMIKEIIKRHHELKDDDRRFYKRVWIRSRRASNKKS